MFSLHKYIKEDINKKFEIITFIESKILINTYIKN